jgi:transmembrane protein TMEM43
VKTISADVMDPADIGRVVHLTGVARGFEPLTDDEVGLSTVALLLERNVSMYQWIEACEGYDVEPSPPRKDEYVETRERRRGRWRGRFRNRPASRMQTDKQWEKCRYAKGWSDEVEDIRSDRVHLYPNPESPLAAGTTLLPANQWGVGAFKIPSGRLPESASKSLLPLAATPKDIERLPTDLRRRARIDGGTILVGDAAAPQLGDLRIRYRVRYAMPVSIVAERDHFGLNTHALPDGSFYFEVREGTHSAAALLGHGPNGRDHWTSHIFQTSFVVLGTFLVFWPLHVWGRPIPGPALLTGAGVLVFVPLVTAAIYAGLLVHLWWDQDRSAALVALLVMAGSGALLLIASAVRQMTRARRLS